MSEGMVVFSRHERRLGVLLVTVGAVLLLAACGGTNGRGKTPLVQQPTTVTAEGRGSAPTSEGRTNVVLTPRLTPRGKVNSKAIDTAVEVIRLRLAGRGIVGAEVTRAGDRIEVSVPGRGHNDVVNLVGQTAQLSFRQVLTAAVAAAAAPPATPPPSGSATVRPSGSPTGAPVTDATLQQQFAAIDCSPAVKRQRGSFDDPQADIVACGRDGTTKFLLGPAEVLGTEVRTATATVDQQGLGQWQVTIDFNGRGTRGFSDLTKRVQPLPNVGSAGCRPPTGCNAVAIVLDGVVQSAPAIQTPISDGQAQITVDVSQKEAKDLASILKYGPLPLAFETSQVVQMSPLPGKS